MSNYPASMDCLENAVRKLGPERSASALRAWDFPFPRCMSESAWYRCALACAYGEPGAFRTELMAQDVWVLPSSFAEQVFGMTRLEVAAITSRFDGYMGASGLAELRAMLEGEAAKMRVSVMASAGRREPNE